MPEGNVFGVLDLGEANITIGNSLNHHGGRLLDRTGAFDGGGLYKGIHLLGWPAAVGAFLRPLESICFSLQVCLDICGIGFPGDRFPLDDKTFLLAADLNSIVGIHNNHLLFK